MARPLRLEFPGAVYHITCRGNERRVIFQDDNDREHYLELLNRAVQRFGWILTAYVLMSNHYHLLVEPTRDNLSRGMHWLNGTYSQRFNRRHERVGHLFQGRYGSRIVEKETYFLTVLRYVVLNPVRANMVTQPEDYEWSSCRATAGLASEPEWLAVDDVLIHFGNERELAQRRYRAFVREGINNQASPWNALVGQIYLGTESWVKKIRERIQLRPRPDDHPRTQRQPFQWTMCDVIDAVARVSNVNPESVRQGRGGTARMLAAWLGRREAELALSSIAAALRLRSASHVSAVIYRCESELSKTPGLRQAAERSAELLHELWRTDKPQV